MSFLNQSPDITINQPSHLDATKVLNEDTLTHNQVLFSREIEPEIETPIKPKEALPKKPKMVKENVITKYAYATKTGF